MADENGTGEQTQTQTEPQNNSTQNNDGGQQTQTPTVVEHNGQQVDITKLLADNERYQREAEQARVNAKAQVARDAQKRQLLSVAEIAGIKIEKPEDETVESLTQKLAGQAASGQQNDEATTQAKRDAAFATAAWNAGAPADKATYLKFLATQDSALQALDPSAADYQTSVNARVKALVDADPIFKTATPGGTGRSGAETFGGAGGTDTVTQEAFDKMTVQEQTKIYQENPDLFRRLAGVA